MVPFSQLTRCGPVASRTWSRVVSFDRCSGVHSLRHQRIGRVERDAFAVGGDSALFQLWTYLAGSS